MGTHRFKVIPAELAIVRLGAHAAVPDWVARAEAARLVDAHARRAVDRLPRQRGFPRECARRTGGARSSSSGRSRSTQVGVLASIVTPLAEAGISVFAISTFDTDYVLVKTAKLADALEALARAGHVRES